MRVDCLSVETEGYLDVMIGGVLSHATDRGVASPSPCPCASKDEEDCVVVFNKE